MRPVDDVVGRRSLHAHDAVGVVLELLEQLVGANDKKTGHGDYHHGAGDKHGDYRISGQSRVSPQGSLVMACTHFAVVNECCPICRQGTVVVAVENDGYSIFVVCEECEAEWNAPDESCAAAMATRDQHSFLRYMEPDDLMDHHWYPKVLNKVQV